MSAGKLLTAEQMAAVRERGANFDIHWLCQYGESAATNAALDRRALLQHIDALEAREKRVLEIIRPHVDLVQASLNGSYCACKIDEKTFCGRAREWVGHVSKPTEWPEHVFVDGAALVDALRSSEGAAR